MYRQFCKNKTIEDRAFEFIMQEVAHVIRDAHEQRRCECVYIFPHPVPGLPVTYDGNYVFEKVAKYLLERKYRINVISETTNQLRIRWRPKSPIGRLHGDDDDEPQEEEGEEDDNNGAGVSDEARLRKEEARRQAKARAKAKAQAKAERKKKKLQQQQQQQQQQQEEEEKQAAAAVTMNVDKDRIAMLRKKYEK